MTKLALDPMCVLSAWEQMGGNAFSSDDVHLDDPEAFTLDLSSWEARLKPLAAPSTSQILDNTNIFASLFNPSGLCFAFLPGCAAAAPTTVFFAPAPAADGAQVVPLCPSNSISSADNNVAADGAWAVAITSSDGCTVMDDTAQCSHLDDDVNMSIHFSDMEPVPSSASPASSSEAGVVPDCDIGGSSRKGGSSTATSSGSLPSAPAAAEDSQVAAAAATAADMLQLPVLPAHLGTGLAHCAGGRAAMLQNSSMFVPICSPPHAGESAGSGGAVGAQQDLESYASSEAAQPQQHHQQQQPHLVQPPPSPQRPQTNSAASTLLTRQGPASAAQPPQQQQQHLPSGGRGHGTSGTTGMAGQPHQQQQQSGTAAHVRTRAECLERYREKKARRLYTKKIRYQLRKINADKRPRIKGRFVKKEELAEFLAAQRGGPAVKEEVEDPYFGMDSDDE